MNKLLYVCAIFLFAVSAFSQTQLPVRFQWDASADGPGPAENPVKYNLCTSGLAPSAWGTATLPADRACVDAGTNLEQELRLSVGIVYVFATAYNWGLSQDGTSVTTITQESGPSNVLRIEVFAPPGRPDKIRIKSVQQVQGTRNGQSISYRAAK